MSTEATFKRPDDLLVEIGRSIMNKALVWSIIGHFVFTIFTSIPLFCDWTHYGIKSPSAINAIRTAENRKAEEEARKKKAQEKAEAAKAAAEAAKTNTITKASGTATNATDKVAGDKAQQAKPAEDGKITPPEVEALPPKKEFEYGDDLSLD